MITMKPGTAKHLRPICRELNLPAGLPYAQAKRALESMGLHFNGYSDGNVVDGEEYERFVRTIDLDLLNERLLNVN